MTFAEAAMIMMSGGSGNIQPLSVTANGPYEAPKGVDGYNPVIVNVPDRYDEGYEDGRNSFVTSHLFANENHKTYIASELGADGFHRVTVDINDLGNIKPLDVTENKTYYATDYGCDGFDPVNVSVPTKEKELQDLEDYFKSKYPDEADNIDTILGDAEFCKAEVEGAKYSFTYRAVRGKFNDSIYGKDCDTYDATIYVTRSDGKEYTIDTTINALTSQGASGKNPPLYGCDDFSKCFFWSHNEGSRWVYLNYRYSSYGSWASYDQWDNAMYNLYD